MTVPIHLQDYSPIEELMKWESNASYDLQLPCWRISYRKRIYMCQLSWMMQGTYMHMDQAALTLQEAVWLLLEDYKRYRKENLIS